MYHIINVLYSASAHAISHAFYCCLKFDECFLCEWHFSLLFFCNLFQTLLLQAFYVSSSTKHVCCIPHIRFFFFLPQTQQPRSHQGFTNISVKALLVCMMHSTNTKKSLKRSEKVDCSIWR